MKGFSLLAVAVISLASSPALSASRTFVSGAGSDSGTCALVTPCRTFAYALTQTSPRGEIVVLDSAGYGPVTITQSVSIINTSSFAGVSVTSTNGITINAGANDSVTLVGLTIDGGGTGANGIVYNSGSKLTIDKCRLINFVVSGPAAGNGVLIQPASGNHNISITNTTASNNGLTGIYYFPPSGSVATAGIVIDGVTANNNLYGIAVNNVNSSGAASAAVSNVTTSFNNSYGMHFGNVTASVDTSYASSNSSDGVFVFSGGLSLGRSVLMNNGGYGLDIDGGTVSSYHDNRIAGNTSGPVLGSTTTATLY